MASHWNTYLDRLLAADLTNEEHRLALTLMRLLLGWRKTSNSIGDDLLRETSGLHGRSLDRARAGLVAKRLIAYQPGTKGRGNRSTYTLIVNLENPAAARAKETGKNPAPERANSRDGKSRENGPENPAPARGRIGRKERTPGLAEPAKTIQARAIDAYRGSGGTLTLERDRGALVRQATGLAKDGLHESTILAAARELGRNREFPGLLKQRATEIQERGGPCKWDGLDRSALTLTQLNECDCRSCGQWATAKSERAETPA